MIQPSYIPSTNGLQSYVDASPEYELAPIGIASMQDQAQKLAEMGRNGDIYVVHAAQGETVIPMEVLEANPQIKALLFNQMTEMGLDPQRYVVGDQLNSLNPVTGMPEFFFSSIFKGIKKAVKSVVKVVKKIAPVVLPIAAAVFGVPFLGAALPGVFGAGAWGSMALANGIGTLIGGGNLKDAFKSAAIGGIGSLIGAGFKGLAAAPKGTGLSGFGAGLEAGITGQTPIFNAAGVQIGTQAPATASQAWKAIVSGDPIGGITSAIKGDLGTFSPTEGYVSAADAAGSFIPSPATIPGDATRYLPNQYTTVAPVAPVAPVPAAPIDRTSVSVSNPNTLAFNLKSPVNVGDTRLVSQTGDFSTNARPFGLDPTDVDVLRGGTGDTVLDQAGIGFDWLDDKLTRAGDYWTRAGATAGEEAAEIAKAEAAYNASAAKHGFAPTEAGLKEFIKASGAKTSTLAKWGPTAAALSLGAYGMGAFETQPEEDPDKTLAAKPDLGIPSLTSAERQALADKQEISTEQIPVADQEVVVADYSNILPSTLLSAARGGSVNYPERDLLVEGPGTEKSDDIPAMLSDGEFVINSRAVRGADPSGRGNRYAGAQNLYNLMRNFEMRA